MDDKKAKELGRFLTERYFDFQRKRGRQTSANTFAGWLGVNPTSLSYWMNGLRLPGGDNVYKLASKLGEEVYRILDIPVVATANPLLRVVVSSWESLPEDVQQDIADKAEQEAAKQAKRPVPQT